MLNENARQIVEDAEAIGLNHQDIAKICQVSVGTISRWKSANKGRANVILLLEKELVRLSEPQRKYLDEATLEELAKRAKELGFNVSFSNAV